MAKRYGSRSSYRRRGVGESDAGASEAHAEKHGLPMEVYYDRKGNAADGTMPPRNLRRDRRQDWHGGIHGIGRIAKHQAALKRR
jgi:hypothetical protein